MSDIDPKILSYCEEHSATTALLDDIERSTFLRTVKPFDASDMIQGRLLSLLAQLIRPRLIVELGTFTGYAAICMAEGLDAQGRLITIEHEETIVPLIREHIAQAGIEDRVELMIGSALDRIKDLPDEIDMVFIDAAKREYIDYYERILPKVRPGGVIICDNVLWKGEVVNKQKNKMASALDGFNKHVSQDDRVEAFILPYRDGLNIIKKK